MTDKNDALRQIKKLSTRLLAIRLKMDDPDSDQRLIAGAAVNAIIDFINDNKYLNNRGLADPLNRLSTALYDLDLGITHPIVKPSKASGGRPPLNRGVQAGRSVAALVVTSLVTLGLSRKEASELVAGRLPDDDLFTTKHGTKISNKSEQVLRWREDLEAGPKPGQDPGIDNFAVIYRDKKKQFADGARLMKSDIESGTLSRQEAIERLLIYLQATMSNRDKFF